MTITNGRFSMKSKFIDSSWMVTTKFAWALMWALLIALTSSAQTQPNTPVELEGWDVSALDSKISTLATKANLAGASIADKMTAAAAYLERANIFFGAGRPAYYKLALGDFRRVLRLQPDNIEAAGKLNTIVSIYQSLLRPVPENGNEADIYNDPNVGFKSKPQLISFPKGHASATLSETLPSGATYVYEVGGRAGQRVSATIEADDGSAVIEIYQVNSTSALPIISEARNWSSILPVTANYLIKVLPKEDGVMFVLKVSVR